MAHKGYVKTSEHRANLAAAGTGHKVSTETRAKISASLKGRSRPDISIRQKGRTLTPEWRRSIAAGVGRGEECGRWKGDEVCYEAAHQRLGALRGVAKEHLCVDCGGQAAHWSLKHEAQQVRYDSRRGSPYSTNPNDYEPRCVSDHIRYDRGKAKT